MPHLFFKTVVKGTRILNLRYGTIDFGDAELFWTKPPIFDMNDDVEIMLSPVFDVIEDPQNNAHEREYRAFVVDGKLYSISRSYIDWPTEVPQEVIDYTKNKINQISKSNFVKSYVLDVTECIVNDKKVIDVVEANPICCAGLEVCNDLLSPLIKDKNNLNTKNNRSKT